MTNGITIENEVSNTPLSPQEKQHRRQLANKIINGYPDEIISNGFARTREFYWPENRVVSTIMLQLLDKAGIATDKIQQLPLGSSFYDEINKLLAELEPDIAKPLRLFNKKPPGHIHWLCRKTGLFFDFRSADTIVETMNECDLSFSKGKTYLDFGCSSGRTVRTLWAAYPECNWIGIDPIKSSIEWASRAFPDIRFVENGFWPPMDAVAANSIHGGAAQSVWSHFSEKAAISWLDEIHRILEPNGFFVLTINGYSELVNFLLKTDAQRGFIKTPVLEEAILALENSGFYFKSGLLKSTVVSDQTDWSQTFILRKWFENVIVPRGWKIRFYSLCRWGHKQDICILEKQA
jgi:SAM-dependent methyltransferase